jgi:hypothetical protein
MDPPLEEGLPRLPLEESIEGPTGPSSEENPSRSSRALPWSSLERLPRGAHGPFHREGAHGPSLRRGARSRGAPGACLGQEAWSGVHLTRSPRTQQNNWFKRNTAGKTLCAHAHARVCVCVRAKTKLSLPNN